jgi:hypothetical protein
MSTPTPLLGRNARLVKNSIPIGYCQNISTEASAESIKVYSMDSLQPAVSGAGKQSFTWSADRLFTDATYLSLLLAGTKFDLVFAPEGNPETGKYETWTNCKLLKRGVSAGEDGGIIEKISGEAEGVTPAS